MASHPQSDVSVLKRIFLSPLLAPGVAQAVATATGTRATIFMLHRFSMPDLGVSGQEPASLRRALAHLRKQRYSLMSLQDLFQKLLHREPLERAVAFTIDDGYIDHGQIGAPIFQEFDCPVTTFLVSSFAEGKSWFWWDKLTYIFEETKRPALNARLGSTVIPYATDSPETRESACRDLNQRCSNASEADRLSSVLDLSREAEVELPQAAPARFAALTWDDVRSLEKRGMTFGPHTVTHPVLSSTPPEQAEFEISESWQRLSSQVSRPVPIFCYPNGRRRDYGEREISTIRRLGLWGAVEGEGGNANAASLHGSENARYRVPRFGYVDSLPHLLQCVSGVETVKARIRGALR
jgi:peptidoglycan/xylan/chitin deacetylase (PgdA/CDA1 family)